MSRVFQPTVLRFDSLPSTNTEALRQAVAGAPEGLCIVAREQTEGRGRLGRAWVSPPGAGLYCSILLRPRLEPRDWPLLPLMAALAASDALRESCPALDPDIKWPNDIHARGRKLCGILAETTETRAGRACVLGIGINLSSRAFPPELSPTATSLEELTGRAPDAEALLSTLVSAIGRRYALLEGLDGARLTVAAWCARSSYAEGKRVRVSLSEETFEGTTRGLETDGALRVETCAGEIRLVRAGDVSALREARAENDRSAGYKGAMIEGKRIVLSTFGSFGDVHPYIAIALELKARGHHPIIATSEVYREKTDALGLELRPVRPELPGFDQPDAVAKMVSKVMDAKTGSREVFELFVVPYLPEIYEDLLAAVEGADLLLTHPLPLVGPIVAEKTGVRWISSVLAPISLFSVYDPPVPPQLPGFHKLLTLSPLVGRAAMQMARLQLRSITEPVQRLRRQLGLPRGGNPIFEGQHSPALVLALFSRVLASPQRDWPRNTRVTGFPFYDRRDRAGDPTTLAHEISQFLEAGAPPIIFTLGSSAFWVAEDFYTESMKAASALGRRALLLVGDERNRPRDTLPEGVAAFDYAPFGELLPRGCATVHQGGVGTTGQALRAGRPSLVVPFSHDQFDNGARVARLGAGRTLPRTQYNARTAAHELEQLLNQNAYADKATRVGQLVQSEDGARTASDLIEAVLRG